MYYKCLFGKIGRKFPRRSHRNSPSDAHQVWKQVVSYMWKASESVCLISRNSHRIEEICQSHLASQGNSSWCGSSKHKTHTHTRNCFPGAVPPSLNTYCWCHTLWMILIFVFFSIREIKSENFTQVHSLELFIVNASLLVLWGVFFLFGVSMATLKALTQKYVTRLPLFYSFVQINIAVVYTKGASLPEQLFFFFCQILLHAIAAGSTTVIVYPLKSREQLCRHTFKLPLFLFLTSAAQINAALLSLATLMTKMRAVWPLTK